jgi:signal peptide peptidase SppA
MTEALRGHSLIKFFTQAEWAILPDKLEQLEDVLNQFIAGDNVLLNDNNNHSPSQSGAIAVIPITGTITKRAYGLSAMSGVRTTIDIQADIQSAIDNPKVSGIVLSIDSPGGTVDGTKELADFVAKAKQTKPIVSYVDGLMASAAYWIGCQSSKIVCFDTAKVGSVGVVVKHQEASEIEAKIGVKTTFIYQGKYKVVGNQHEKLSDEGKAYIQGHVDTYYSMFVDAVAAGRNIKREVVISDIALGSVFIGQDALDINLVDSIGNIHDAISLAHQLGEEKMNLEETKAALEAAKAELATLGTQIATTSAQLSDATATITTLTAQVEERDAKLDKLAQEEAAAKRLAEVTAMFDGCKVDDAFVATMIGMPDEAISLVATQLKARQTTIDKSLAGHLEPTPNAHSEQGNMTVPASIDEAITMIEERDGIDVDAAQEKAQEEFPSLFA